MDDELYSLYGDAAPAPKPAQNQGNQPAPVAMGNETAQRGAELDDLFSGSADVTWKPTNKPAGAGNDGPAFGGPAPSSFALPGIDQHSRVRQ